ncbi:MAG: hypothetical protein ACKO2L_22070 [Planctomycetaceae bacterium]
MDRIGATLTGIPSSSAARRSWSSVAAAPRSPAILSRRNLTACF